MKETLLKIPLFGLVAALLYLPLVALYLLYQQVLPGREGLVFGSALSFALLPSLTGALLITINSMHHHPGNPLVSLGTSLLCFFTALVMSFTFSSELTWSPLKVPAIKTGLIYANGSEGLLADSMKENRLMNLVVKRPGDTIRYYPWGEFDGINNRILFSDGSSSLTIPTSVQEVAFFSPPEVLVGIFSDINYTYRLLSGIYASDFNRFLLLCVLLTGLFSGLTVFMHIKVWPLIKWSLLLIGLRFAFFFVRFSFHDAVYLASRWTVDRLILDILPYTLVLLVGAFLLNITLFKLPFKAHGEKSGA